MKSIYLCIATSILLLSSCSFGNDKPSSATKSKEKHVVAPWEIIMDSGTTVVNGGWVVPIK